MTAPIPKEWRTSRHLSLGPGPRQVHTDIPASTFLECILGRETGTSFANHTGLALPKRRSLREEVTLRKAFCNLKRIDTGSVADKPRVLLVVELIGME